MLQGDVTSGTILNATILRKNLTSCNKGVKSNFSASFLMEHFAILKMVTEIL